jgi:LuxR family maltose regulon positive regulatory protein
MTQEIEEMAGVQPAVAHIERCIREALNRALTETLARIVARDSLGGLLDELAGGGAWPPAGRSPAPPPGGALTAREREILKRIAAGDSNKAIARAFDLSVHTVKRHVANILGKIGVSSRVQAALWMRAHH